MGKFILRDMAKGNVSKQSVYTKDHEISKRIKRAQTYATTQRRKHGHAQPSLPKIKFLTEKECED